MFKIGRVVAKGGHILWHSSAQDEMRSTTQDGLKLEDDVVYSTLRKELSVITPSIATFASKSGKSRAKSYLNSRTSSNSFHMANPNPQPDRNQYKYKGIRDVGYNQYSNEMDPTDVIKFGKKVYHGSKMTNEQVMEHHLR